MKKTHGHRSARKGLQSLTYVSWRCMKQRCSNPKHKSYEDYGGRSLPDALSTPTGSSGRKPALSLVQQTPAPQDPRSVLVELPPCTECEALRAEIQRSTKSTQSQTDTVRALYGEKEQLEGRIKNLSKEIEALSASKEEYRTQTATQLREIEGLKATLLEKSKQLQEANLKLAEPKRSGAVRQLEEELSRSQRNSQAIQEDMKARYERLDAAHSELKTTCSRLQHERDTAEEKAKAAESLLEEAAKKPLSLEQALEAMVTRKIQEVEGRLFNGKSHS